MEGLRAGCVRFRVMVLEDLYFVLGLGGVTLSLSQQAYRFRVWDLVLGNAGQGRAGFRVQGFRASGFRVSGFRV